MTTPKTYTFNDIFEPIKEGAVEICFEKSNGKIKTTFIIDFAKTNLTPLETAKIHKEIVEAFKTGLGVKLSKFDRGLIMATPKIPQQYTLRKLKNLISS